MGIFANGFQQDKLETKNFRILKIKNNLHSSFHVQKRQHFLWWNWWKTISDCKNLHEARQEVLGLISNSLFIKT